MDDTELAWRAIASRDSRFDGVFFTGVATTRIYCRPSCPARTPARHNVRFFSTSAAARHAGYRACKRCRPDASPGSPEWNRSASITARAVTIIGDGVVDREGVRGLAQRLGYSERQVLRTLRGELGVGPLELARSNRIDTARLLLETTTLSMAEIAFGAGFSSIRQFNDSIRVAFELSPSEVRARAPQRQIGRNPGGAITLNLPVRAPFSLDALLGFLGRRAVQGLEEYDGTAYRRALRLPRANGIVAVDSDSYDGRGSLRVELTLGDLRDLTSAVARTRRLFDMDADPIAISEVLRGDLLLEPLVLDEPGRRVPGHPDPSELAFLAVIGQQISVQAARQVAGKLVARFGEPVELEAGSIQRIFPTPEVLATAPAADLPMPRTRQQSVVALARALLDGELDLSPGADRDRAEKMLRTIPGIGPSTLR